MGMGLALDRDAWLVDLVPARRAGARREAFRAVPVAHRLGLPALATTYRNDPEVARYQSWDSCDEQEAKTIIREMGAARDGVVDMVYTPCAFYAAQVPECDAVSAATIDGPTARKNGGMDLLNQIHQKRIGIYNLGWVDSGIRFNLWSTKEPKLDSNGHIDIKGFKVRGHPIYNAFLTNYLGAQVINVNSPDLYTALERGTVEMSAWTQIGLMDLNWDRYLKFRILPEFFSTDLHILVNLKKWQSLSPKTREILQRVAIQHESESLQALQKLWKEEEAELKRRVEIGRVHVDHLGAEVVREEGVVDRVAAHLEALDVDVPVRVELRLLRRPEVEADAAVDPAEVVDADALLVRLVEKLHAAVLARGRAVDRGGGHRVALGDLRRIERAGRIDHLDHAAPHGAGLLHHRDRFRAAAHLDGEHALAGLVRLLHVFEEALRIDLRRREHVRRRDRVRSKNDLSAKRGGEHRCGRKHLLHRASSRCPAVVPLSYGRGASYHPLR
jgi:TRAP-type mannitol/chloroaromatic compound transport system substrate-binding protein